jgi:small glutamine-rich tetratricopeptide repeat-containing protein alpha
MKTGLQNSESKTAGAVGDAIPPSAASSDPRTDPGPGGLGGLADTLRNMGGGDAGGAGGMPDIASLMNNPAMMQMAQQMMANGGMDRLMSNPTVANMVSCIKSILSYGVALLILSVLYQMDRVNSGGNLPSMEELMGNPELQEL